MINVTVSSLVMPLLNSLKSAFAYLDPGTGSAILQGVLAALAAIAIVLKLYWHRLLKFLGLRKKEANQEDLESLEE